MTTVEFFGQPKVNELRCTITLRNTNKNIVGFDIAVQDAETLQINQGVQQIAQNGSDCLHWNYSQDVSSVANVSVANICLQGLPTIILNEVNGWIPGVSLARDAIWRHVPDMGSNRYRKAVDMLGAGGVHGANPACYFLPQNCEKIGGRGKFYNAGAG